MEEAGKYPNSGFVNPLMEHLTPREKEVLVLLAQDLTAREIADQLTIAPTSAKWHIQQIYGKLGAHNRKKAIQRARELDLLTDSAIPSKWTAPKHNLPRQLTRFIGRENEIEQLRSYLMDHPLVTLTGSGGVGKTRLCLQVAGEILDQYRDGVWLVELSTITDPDLLEDTVSGVFGLREGSEQPIHEILFNFLRNRQALIILDNCEHLLDACAQLASHLLNDCQRVSLMASSREALGVPGEMTYSVPSMSFPDPEQLPSPMIFEKFEAILLFVERAQAALPGFEVTLENVKLIAQICKRLDGIPLAIELAAARMNTLTTNQLESRLDHAFRLLTGGSRTVLPRQQTLRATIDWSYQLLDDVEKALLRNLSVFSGGCDLEAAEEVFGGDVVEREAVLDILSSLVNKSMVIADRQQGVDTRYYLLETVRQYAREKLFDLNESEALRDRHLEYYMRLSERAEPELRSAGRLVWTKRMKNELGNLRAAMDWAFQDPTRIQSGFRLAGGIGFRIMSSFGTAKKWINVLLTGLKVGERYPISPLYKTRIYNLLGWLLFYSEDQTSKASWFEKSNSIWRH